MRLKLTDCYESLTSPDNPLTSLVNELILEQFVDHTLSFFHRIKSEQRLKPLLHSFRSCMKNIFESNSDKNISVSTARKMIPSFQNKRKNDLCHLEPIPYHLIKSWRTPESPLLLVITPPHPSSLIQLCSPPGRSDAAGSESRLPAALRKLKMHQQQSFEDRCQVTTLPESSQAMAPTGRLKENPSPNNNIFSEQITSQLSNAELPLKGALIKP